MRLRYTLLGYPINPSLASWVRNSSWQKPAWLHTWVRSALLAEGFSGAGTPFAKLLLSQVSLLLRASLLCSGSGLGMSVYTLIPARRTEPHDAELTRRMPRGWQVRSGSGA